jgi:hypothetical protein
MNIERISNSRLSGTTVYAKDGKKLYVVSFGLSGVIDHSQVVENTKKGWRVVSPLKRQHKIIEKTLNLLAVA